MEVPEKITSSDSENSSSFEILRIVRVVKGLTLRETAKEADISSTYLQKIERDQVQEPSPHVLRRLGRVSGVPYPHLFELAGYGRLRELPEESEERTMLSFLIGDPGLSVLEAELLLVVLRQTHSKLKRPE